MDVILEGEAVETTDADRLGALAEAFRTKYDDWFAMELGVVLRIHRRSHAEPSGWLVYRFGIPLIASAVLAAGGLGMWLGWPPAVWAPALFVFATVIVGVQDAWDLLISRDVGPV